MVEYEGFCAGAETWARLTGPTERGRITRLGPLDPRSRERCRWYEVATVDGFVRGVRSRAAELRELPAV